MNRPAPSSWAIDPADASAQLCAPGLWRLRLPLPYAGNSHVNAYVVARDDGIMLVDCGTAGHPSCTVALADALCQSGHEVGDVRVFVATHAHSDHVGLAAWLQERSGCETLMHRDVAHFYDAIRDPARIAEARVRRARQELVPERFLEAFCEFRTELESAQDDVAASADLHEGMRLASALGDWEVIETPGHAPSHVCLVQREAGLAIVGDTVCSVFVPWFDYGYSPDPVAELLASLERLLALGPLRQAFPGHGRPIRDLQPVVASHRAGVADRMTAVRRVVEQGGVGAVGAFAVAHEAFGTQASEIAAVERTTEAAVYLHHLRLSGELRRVETADGGFRYEAIARSAQLGR